MRHRYPEGQGPFPDPSPIPSSEPCRVEPEGFTGLRHSDAPAAIRNGRVYKHLVGGRNVQEFQDRDKAFRHLRNRRAHQRPDSRFHQHQPEQDRERVGRPLQGETDQHRQAHRGGPGRVPVQPCGFHAPAAVDPEQSSRTSGRTSTRCWKDTTSSRTCSSMRGKARASSSA